MSSKMLDCRSFKMLPLPDRSLGVPFGGQYDVRTHVLGCNCRQAGVLSFGKVAGKVAARERPTSKFWEQSIIDDR
jgi:hypothetical protein